MKKLKLNKKTGIILLITFSFFLVCLPLSVFASSDILSPTIPGGLTISNITYTSISLRWTAASDNIGIKGYHVYRDGKEISSTTKTSYINNSLVPGKKYTYFIKAYDAVGNVSAGSSVLSVTTTSDNQIPSTPKSLTPFSKTYTSISLTWNQSIDNTKIKNYIISCNEKKIATTSNYYYVCKGLIPGKSYNFSVLAMDIAGNYSIKSNSISDSTLIDSSSPSMPTGLNTLSVGYNEVNLTWYPSIDNVKVKGYEIFCEGFKIGTTNKTTYTSKRLLPGKSYTYNIKAIDAVGNLSDISSPLTVTTQYDLMAPTTPTGLKADSVNDLSVSLTWNASLDNIRVKGYYVFCNGFKIATTTRTYYNVKSPVGLGLDVYCIKAFDSVDNLSAGSNSTTVISSK